MNPAPPVIRYFTLYIPAGPPRPFPVESVRSPERTGVSESHAPGVSRAKTPCKGTPAAPDFNMLRAEYQLDPQKADSHPNRRANEAIAPQFVAFVNQAVEAYKAP